MKKIVLNNCEYELINNEGDCFNYDTVNSLVTEYFDNFDYIFGDIAYDKIRLKGFYSEDNKKVKEINNIKNLDDYKKKKKTVAYDEHQMDA